MYCPNCGHYNEEDAAFCGSCGTPPRRPETAEREPEIVPGRPEPERQSARDLSGENGCGPVSPVPGKKKSRKIWIILAAVLVIAAAAAAAVFLWILTRTEE